MQQRRKKLLCLGAAAFQLPAIQYAKAAGYSVITLDNRPENPGHALADVSENISTLDYEAVLACAQRHHIDGVISYASDVSALTAARVAETLGLPGVKPDIIERLTDKGQFRTALAKSGIQTLPFRVFQSDEQVAALAYIKALNYQCVIKPVDASGGRGVTIVEGDSELTKALSDAFVHSCTQRILIEATVPHTGYQICGDGLMMDGKLCFVQFGDGVFYPGQAAPYAEMFPSLNSEIILSYVEEKLAVLLNGLGYDTGVVNIDCLITPEGEPFFLEVGPRNGGNFLSEAIALATGVDLTAIAVELALGGEVPITFGLQRSVVPTGCYAMHTCQSGRLAGVNIASELMPFIRKQVRVLPEGATINPFKIGRDAAGYCLLQFDSMAQMKNIMEQLPMLCEVSCL